jgi:hypothetical protein
MVGVVVEPRDRMGRINGWGLHCVAIKPPRPI